MLLLLLLLLFLLLVLLKKARVLDCVRSAPSATAARAFKYYRFRDSRFILSSTKVTKCITLWKLAVFAEGKKNAKVCKPRGARLPDHGEIT